MRPLSSRIQKLDLIGGRDEQQDAHIALISADQERCFLVVSDGVGGKNGGADASRIVMQEAARIWKEQGERFDDPEKMLKAFTERAHDAINQWGGASRRSPSATVVALYYTRDHAWWIHSGDSRLYHFTQGRYAERTADHSVVQILVNQGEIGEEEMGTHPDQGVLLRCLGGEEYRKPSLGNSPVDMDSAFLLCTDGFWERTTKQEMESLVATSPDTTKEALWKAIAIANGRNGPRGDNITAVLLLPSRLTSKQLPPPVASHAKESLRNLYWLILGLTILLAGLAAAGWFIVKNTPVSSERALASEIPILYTPTPAQSPPTGAQKILSPVAAPDETQMGSDQEIKGESAPAETSDPQATPAVTKPDTVLELQHRQEEPSSPEGESHIGDRFQE